MTTSNESETPETDAMTRLYREQVAPVLDTLAAGACTRILNKMGQIERERNALRSALAAIQGELPPYCDETAWYTVGIGLTEECPGPTGWQVEIFPAGTRARLSSLSGMKRGEG